MFYSPEIWLPKTFSSGLLVQRIFHSIILLSFMHYWSSISSLKGKYAGFDLIWQCSFSKKNAICGDNYHVFCMRAVISWQVFLQQSRIAIEGTTESTFTTFWHWSIAQPASFNFLTRRIYAPTLFTIPIVLETLPGNKVPFQVTQRHKDVSDEGRQGNVPFLLALGLWLFCSSKQVISYRIFFTRQQISFSFIRKHIPSAISS